MKGISRLEMEKRIVRYGDLQPCRTAFIDAHTPGSNHKENFTIIGGGVSESPDQHVHIQDTPGFNIGAAGQPPHCKNSLHLHTTAEVFFVLSGRWRFFWGLHGTAGEVICEAGDIFNIPTGVFRGFENIGNDYGMIMSILGGDDAGGGVTWAPQVIEEAKAHGLILGNDGRLYDSKKGESLPEGIEPMAQLTKEALKQYPEVPTSAIVPHYVARYWDMMALAKEAPCQVIGEHALIKDKPGFSVEFLTRGSISEAPYQTDCHEILMVKTGHWTFKWLDDTGEESQMSIAPGDVVAVPPNLTHRIYPSMSGEAALFRVKNTAEAAGATWIQS